MLSDEITVKRGCPGIFKICGQLSESGENGCVGFIKIKVCSSRQVRLVLEAVQAGIKNQCKSKIWVGSRIRRTKFNPSVFSHSSRNSYQLGTVFT